MNILYICHEYPPAAKVGGIGFFIRNISTWLISQGHSVTAVGLYNQPHDTEEISDGVKVLRISSTKSFFRLGWWLHRRRMFNRIEQAHKQRPFDIIETSDYEAGYWLMPSISCPRIIRMNGSETYFRTILKEPLKPKYHFIEQKSFNKADALVAVSSYTWEETYKLFRLKPQAKTVIHNGVNIDSFKPEASVAPVKGRIVYTGTVVRKKGVLELFKALNIVFNKNHDAHIVCVGGDSKDVLTGSPSTMRMALDLLDERHRHRVTFAGRLPNTEVKNHILAAEVCAYPSFLEAHPFVVLEAMACGAAVVASILGPGPETIEHGVSGLLCHPTDTPELSKLIIQVLTDADLRKTLGDNARATVVKKYSNADLFPMNLSWYRRVINEFHL